MIKPKYTSKIDETHFDLFHFDLFYTLTSFIPAEYKYDFRSLNEEMTFVFCKLQIVTMESFSFLIAITIFLFIFFFFASLLLQQKYLISFLLYYIEQTQRRTEKREKRITIVLICKLSGEGDDFEYKLFYVQLLLLLL